MIETHSPHRLYINRGSGQGEYEKDLSLDLIVLADTDEGAMDAAREELRRRGIDANGASVRIEVRRDQAITISGEVLKRHKGDQA